MQDFAISALQFRDFLVTLRQFLKANQRSSNFMEAFFRTHRYLVEHVNAPVRRTLMDEIDWSDRLIGIKGTQTQS